MSRGSKRRVAFQHESAPTTSDAQRRNVTRGGTQLPTQRRNPSTALEHVSDDIVVWRGRDQGGVTSSRTPVAVPLTSQPEDTGEADEWFGVGAGSRFVNLHFILGALRRRWRWVAGFAIAGLVAGVLLSVVFAPAPQAATTLLLTHPDASDPTLAMVTDAQLLESKAIARRVVASLHLDESPAAFAPTYTGDILSNDLLKVSVSASSGSDAVRRVNALADEYLAYRADVYRRQSNAIVDGLQKRQAAIQDQINKLNGELGAQAGSVTSTDPAIAALLAQRASLNDNLTSLSGAIASQTSSTAAVVGGSSIIDPGASVERSNVQQLARNALSGLAAGLVTGLALVVLLAVTSRRVWRRDDVAQAMRHPVDLSTGRIGVRRWMAALEAEELVTHPTADLARVVAHLRDQLASSASSRRSLAVVATGRLEVAAVSVCATAKALARDGGRVVIVDTSKRSIVSDRLLGEHQSDTTHADGCGDIRVLSSANDSGPAVTDAEEIVLVLAKLDPAEGADPIRQLTSSAVAIVTAGQSTMAKLRAASEMLEAAQVDLRSVVLVNSSAYDDSFGRAVNADVSPPKRSSTSDAWPVVAEGP